MTMGIRPEHVHTARAGETATMAMRVDVVEPLGAEVVVLGEIEGTAMTAKLDPDTRVKVGDVITLGVDVEHIHLFDRQSTRSLRA
jgi:multiple sugar transport system ATP-binding protein